MEKSEPTSRVIKVEVVFMLSTFRRIEISCCVLVIFSHSIGRWLAISDILTWIDPPHAKWTSLQAD